MKTLHPVLVVTLGMLLCLTSQQAHSATIWSEVGDAGGGLAQANVTTGLGALDAITGTLPDDDEFGVDLFAINISDLSQFSATTDNYPATELLDSWLFLFDSSGYGIAASATTAGDPFPSLNATISLDSVSGTPGLYYLAVARFETFPQSADGAIFLDLFDNSISGEVLKPLGPGGLSPLSSWSSQPPFFDSEAYRIDLTGAEFASDASVVPEPSSMACTLGLLALGYLGKRRIARRQ